MKLLGSVLVFISALYGYLLYRHGAARTIRLLRELADDLRLLRCRICVQRAALPVILEKDLSDGLSGRYLWMPLAARLARAEGAFDECWERSMDELPLMIAQRLAPLGKLLNLGGNTLERAIDETHRELLLLAQEQQRSSLVNSRLSAAVCFSGAAFLVLVFL